MKQIVGMALAALVMASVPGRAQAVDEKNVGLVMGYPTSVGVLWQATPRIAIRPELSLDFGSTESVLTIFVFNGVSQSTQRHTDSRQVGIGASMLFTVGRWDATALYLAPRYRYVRRDGTTTSRTERIGIPGASGVVIEEEESSDGDHVVSGSLAVSHRLATRFGVFGEVGLEHTRTGFDRQFDLDDANFTFHDTGIRSAAGIVFFF